MLLPCVTVRGFQLSFNHSSKWLCLVVGESLKAVLMVAVAVSDAAVTRGSTNEMSWLNFFAPKIFHTVGANKINSMQIFFRKSRANEKMYRKWVRMGKERKDDAKKRLYIVKRT